MATNKGSDPEEDPTMKQIKNGIKTGVGLFILLLVVIGIFSALYTIKSGQEGVLLTFGKADPVPSYPGLHAKIPFVQSIVKFNVQTQKFGADASKSTLESAASKDLQTVKIQLAINYHLASGKTPNIFTNLGSGYEDTVISPTVHEVVKSVTAKYTAEELITNREKVSADMESLLKEKLQPYNIAIEQVSIVNFDFSEQFNKAIEAKTTAVQDALAAKNRLAQIEFEAQQVKAAAEGKMDARIAEATGEAKYVELVQQQLAKSPQYVEYIKAKTWNGQYPQFYMTGGNSPSLLMQLPTISNNGNQTN
jgi:prohibitin 2